MRRAIFIATNIALLAAQSAPAFAGAKPIETAGRSSIELVQEAGVDGAFAAVEAPDADELGFQHVRSGAICRVPSGSRLWLYVETWSRRGDGASCYFTDDFRHAGFAIFRQPLGQTLEQQLKVADLVCLDVMPDPTNIRRDESWDHAMRERAIDSLSIRFLGEIPNEGPFFCATSVAVVNGWTFVYRYMARVYSDDEAEQWDQDALVYWRATLAPLATATPE